MIKISLVPIGKIEEKILSYLQAQLPVKLKTGNLEIKVRPALPAPDHRKMVSTVQGLSALVPLSQFGLIAQQSQEAPHEAR